MLALISMIVTACGIPHDREPELMPGGVVAPVLAPREPGPSALLTEVPVFLVQTEHLVKVERRAAPGDLTGVLGRLLAGPKEEEFAAGIRTAIGPQTELLSARVDGDTAIVDLSAAFVEVGGEEQILAVAQIVLTATSVSGIGQVKLLLEGQAVDVPRADGTLTAEALRRRDYEGLLGPGS